jgi:hypothetical protein
VEIRIDQPGLDSKPETFKRSVGRHLRGGSFGVIVTRSEQRHTIGVVPLEKIELTRILQKALGG